MENNRNNRKSIKITREMVAKYLLPFVIARNAYSSLPQTLKCTFADRSFSFLGNPYIYANQQNSGRNQISQSQLKHESVDQLGQGCNKLWKGFNNKLLKLMEKKQYMTESIDFFFRFGPVQHCDFKLYEFS